MGGKFFFFDNLFFRECVFVYRIFCMEFELGNLVILVLIDLIISGYLRKINFIV